MDATNLPSMKKTLRLLSVLAVLGLSSAASQAAVLMLDFGPTTASGANLVNSPYHASDLSFTGSNWNKIQTTDVGSGLSYADGTAATGVSLDLGSAGASSSTISLTTAPSNSGALGSLSNTGVYAGTSVGTDGIWNGSSASGQRYVGFQLGGLSAGTYDVYVASRNTSASVAYGQTVYLGASSSAGNFDATTLSLSQSVSYTGASDDISAWADNGNYLKFTITLGASQYLNLGVTGTGGELRGFLNSVQIVAVPEPGALTLLGLAGAVCVLRRRR